MGGQEGTRGRWEGRRTGCVRGTRVGGQEVQGCLHVSQNVHGHVQGASVKGCKGGRAQAQESKV